MPDLLTADAGTTLVEALDLIGIFVFAWSGALVAIERRFDLVGVATLALVTGLAGGVLRDVLLGQLPPLAIREQWFLAVALLAAVAAVAGPRLLDRVRRPVLVLDAIGLGLFAVTGAGIAVDAGVGVVGAVLIGTLAATGGGLLRDVLAAEVPQVFVDGSVLYVIPAAIGALLVVVGGNSGLPNAVVDLSAGATVTTVRLLALRRGWSAPLPRRSGPRRTGPSRR